MKLKGASWACRAKKVVFPTFQSCFSGIVDLARFSRRQTTLGIHQYLDPFFVPFVAYCFRKCFMGNKSTTPCFYIINFFVGILEAAFFCGVCTKHDKPPWPAMVEAICRSQILDPFRWRWRNIFETTTVNIWPTCQHKSCTCMRGRLLRVRNSRTFQFSLHSSAPSKNSWHHPSIIHYHQIWLKSHQFPRQIYPGPESAIDFFNFQDGLRLKKHY